MKKMWLIVGLLLLLSGCGTAETFETVSDEAVQPAMAEPRQITVRLPEGEAAPKLEELDSQVYLSETYEIIIETKAAGDLDGTIRSLSGFASEKLTVLKTQSGDVNRYEFVWAAAGEQGDRIGRAVVLDDGNYHYCLTALRDASELEYTQIVWSDVFASFDLVY